MSGGAPPDLLGKDEVASSNLASSSKNPECVSVRDFTFSLFTFHSSLNLAFGIFGK